MDIDLMSFESKPREVNSSSAVLSHVVHVNNTHGVMVGIDHALTLVTLDPGAIHLADTRLDPS